MREHKRILIIRPDRIGDVLLATPLIRALRQRFPDSYIAALVRPSVSPVLKHNPFLDSIITDDVSDKIPSMEGFSSMLKEIRSHHFDTALMLLPTQRHAWMMFLAGIRTRIGVGTKLYQLLTFTKSVSRNKYNPLRYEADYCLDHGRRIGVESNDLSLEAFVTEDEKTHATELLRSIGCNLSKPLVSVHPESGGSVPNWKLERYAQLVSTVLQADADVQVLISLTPENKQGRQLFTSINHERIFLPQDHGDLRLVMAIISHAKVTVSSSTGPMHIAAGLHIPVIALYCRMPACSNALWGPATGRNEFVLPPQHYCQTQCPGGPKVCTFDGGIEIVDVRNAVLRLLR